MHPAEVIRQAEEEWIPRWTADHVSCAEVDSLLRRLPEVPSVEVEVSFTAAKLLKAAGKMQGKSGGPDNWEVCHFQALPSGFWEALASLWQVVYSTSRVPRRWREARVCLVSMATGGHRPISVLSVAYRLGASVLSRELRRWTEQWLGARIMGGFHGRSTRDVFLRILHAAEDPMAMFVGEDVSKFFDSLSGPHVLRVLEHLKAPPALVGFVGSIMKEQWRVFSSCGRLGAKWHLATKGAAQGDPLSPLIAGAVMWVWTSWVAAGDAEAVAFVDDRSFWELFGRRLGRRQGAERGGGLSFSVPLRPPQVPACCQGLQSGRRDDGGLRIFLRKTYVTLRKTYVTWFS